MQPPLLPPRRPRPPLIGTAFALLVGFGFGGTAHLPVGRLPEASADDASCPGLVRDANQAIEECVKTHDLSRARDALRILDRASKLCTDDIEVPFLEGIAQSQLGNGDGVRSAREKCERLAIARALELNRPRSDGPNAPHVLFLEAIVHRQFGNKPGDAAATIRRLKNRDPDFRPEGVTALLFLSLLEFSAQLMQGDDADGALAQARAAQAVAGRNVSRFDAATHRVGKILSATHRFLDAQPLLEDLAKRYPLDAEVRFDLAGVYADQFHFEPAVDAWKETIRLLGSPGVNPRLVDLLSDAPMRLGVCLAGSKRPDEGPAVGKRQLLAYTEAHPNDSRGWYFLAKVEVDYLDDPDAAITHFERARSLDSACEKSLRELYKLYATVRRDDGKAKALEEDVEKGSKSRADEMKRRQRTRPDGSNGCY